MALLDPTPAKGALSAVASVGFDTVHNGIESTETVLAVTISDWAAYASIATLVFALVSLFIALPRIIETTSYLRRWFRGSVMGHDLSRIEAQMDRIEKEVTIAADRAKSKIDHGVEEVVSQVRQVGTDNRE